MYIQAGYKNNGTKEVAKVWKNASELFVITGGSGDVKAYSVYVVGKDVYVAGEEGDTAKVWKNGEELYKLTDNGEAYSMVVYNGDVYVAGEEGGTAKVWKNGQEIYSLADKGRAYSIFIAERK